MIDGPGVVTGRYGTIGQVFYLDEPFWPLNTTLYVSNFKSNDPRFASYLLRTIDFLAFSDKAAVPGVNRNHVHEAIIRWPASLAEQKRIAGILGALDDKIELNRRMSQTLESMARALFKSWFIDFDPVRAKAAGREPDLPNHLSDLFPNSFTDSDIGLVPDGWNVGTLADVLSEMETGGRPIGGVARYDHGVASVGAESIVGLGIFDYAKTKYVPGEFFDGMTKGRVKNGDVLLYKDGGRPGLFEPHSTLVGDGFPFERFAINEHVYRLRAIQDYGQSLLFFWLTSDFAEAEMRVRGTGVAIPGLNSVELKSLTTLIPTAAIAKAFSALVDPLVASILANGRECRELSQLRDLMLPELLAEEVGRHAYSTASVRTSSVARQLPSLEGGRQQ
jgi:type I restriction enzyme S subunit